MATIVPSKSKLDVSALAAASSRASCAMMLRQESMYTPHSVAVAVGHTTVEDTFDEHDIRALEALFDGKPPGRFLNGRYGVTHYLVEEPTSAYAKQPREVVCCAHGLGTNLHVYDELSKALLLAGFTVLRYDYLNHGWSKSSDPYLVIGELVMVTQVEELLNQVLGEDEALHNFVGHSTGGVIAIQAARALRNRKIDRLGLVSPAVFVNKPLVAVLADHVPNFMFNLLKWGFKPIITAVEDSYIRNCHLAFARDKKTKRYRHEGAYKSCLAEIQRVFAFHPYTVAGIMSISNFYLNEALLPLWRQYHREIDAQGVRTLVLYGDEDIIVPNLATLAAGNPNTRCKPLEKQGHESLYENTSTISPHLVSFFNTRRQQPSP
jgi:pimeloyl-ACP methyl ester carboxylesterase